MSKKNNAKSNKKAVSKPAQQDKKKIILKRIGLASFLTFGTLIILAASFVVYALFASNNINNLTQVASAKDFITLYEQNEFERDLPDNLILTEQSLTIDTVNHTYTIAVAMKCSAEYERPLHLQLFYNLEYEDGKKGLKNPFISIDEDDATVLGNKIERFSTTGTFSKDTDINELEKLLSNIYMEAKLGHDIGRVILPLDVYVE